MDIREGGVLPSSTYTLHGAHSTETYCSSRFLDFPGCTEASYFLHGRENDVRGPDPIRLFVLTTSDIDVLLDRSRKTLWLEQSQDSGKSEKSASVKKVANGKEDMFSYWPSCFLEVSPSCSNFADCGHHSYLFSAASLRFLG